jgi:uncharacterized protein (TIGR02145 family)
MATLLPLLTASLTLAMIFTFSCSSGDTSRKQQSSSSNKSSSSGSSSSSLDNSSSSIIFVGCPIYNSATHFCDSRDGKIYKWVKIGNHTWMAENLDNAVEGGKCYNNTANCNTYGRLYDWATAMALPANCNSAFCNDQVILKYRGICPVGWHIPSHAEWKALMTSVGGDSTAGRYLKAASSWNSYGNGQNNNGNGQDTYDFAALPGGCGYSDGSFNNVGYYGYWWSSSERGSGQKTYIRLMYYSTKKAGWGYYDKSNLYSVRCVQD